jgi:menaquinone-9 beta-reductase
MSGRGRSASCTGGSAVERRDVVIIGGGPAGTGTALALQRLDPGLAARTLLLDRAMFPRDKTCAGGLIPHTLELLGELDLTLGVPHVRVDLATVEAGGRPIEIAQPGCCWIVRRREFDAHLLGAARERGLEVREGVAVHAVERAGGWIRVATSAGAIECRAVVGADGSGSLVRRALVGSGPGWLARAAMCDVPIAAARAPGRFEFDFRGMEAGLKGYLWSFPCLIEGRPHWNVGAYSLRRSGEGGRIARLLDERAGCPQARRHAHPIRLYRPGDRLSAPGALLVGDAAGVDPLLGEGISYALEYGRHAANALATAFASGDLSFGGYGAAVGRSPMGRKLRRLALMARLFYGSGSRFWFWVARRSGRAQRIGMDWYNNGEA